MKRIEYTVPSKHDGNMIKNILRRELGISAAVLTELKKHPDGIVLNGENVYATHKVHDGDIITLTLHDKPSQNIEPAPISLDIIYEDEDILAVNKPRSMPTHPSQNHHCDTLANGVMYYFRNTEFTFRVITRLDKDTSGVVVIAKNKISAAKLTEQMTQGEIRKEYEAICHGSPVDNSGTINAPIARKEGSAIAREVNPGGKTAVTEYEVIARSDSLCHIRLRPITGRTHQIRVHLAYIGTPIYGDDLYGSWAQDEKCRLHCRKVTLAQPLTGKTISLEAPAPGDMDLISIFDT